jgi:hypothetical protein
MESTRREQVMNVMISYTNWKVYATSLVIQCPNISVTMWPDVAGHERLVPGGWSGGAICRGLSSKTMSLTEGAVSYE